MKLRDLNPACVSRGDDFIRIKNNVYDEFAALAINAVKIVNAETGDEMEAPVQRFVKNALFEKSAIGYDKIADRWAYAEGEGLTEYGLPTAITFVIYSTTRRKTSYRRAASYEPSDDGAYYITCVEGDFSFAAMVDEAAELIAKCRIFKRQNLEACATPFVAVVKDESVRLSIEHALEQKTDGAPILVVSTELGDMLKGTEMSTPVVFDKIDDFEQKIYDRTLNKIGTMSSNINKRERVQVGEVNATVGQCEDFLYTMIDWFNKQMTTYDLPWRMETNNSLEELYATEQGEENNEVTTDAEFTDNPINI